MDTAVLTQTSSPQTTANFSDLCGAVEQVITKWEHSPSPLRDAIVGVRDRAQGRYTLLQLSRPHGLQIAHTLAHLEINHGKIYVEVDATEEGMGNELVEVGVPKSQIVLAFYPPALRAMGEFAVS